MESSEALAKDLDLLFNPLKAPTTYGIIDRIELAVAELPRVWGEVTETGTPGLYSRQIWLPKGTLLTSCIHKTCHQFIVTEGVVTVYNAIDNSQVTLKAGDSGITMPGTRRVLYTHENLRWTTYHPVSRIGIDFLSLDKNEQQVIFDTIMREDILQAYYNPLITNFEEGVFI